MTGSMVYRLKVAAADQTHMQSFVAAMASIQARLDNEGYNHIAGFHGAPSWFCWHHQSNPRTTLQARLFLPWHRAYLWWLEQALQDVDEKVALPWWDWTIDRGIPNAYAAMQIDGQPNPLRRESVTNLGMTALGNTWLRSEPQVQRGQFLRANTPRPQLCDTLIPGSAIW